MKTITPFKQLVMAEIERLQNVATVRIPATHALSGFPSLSNSYTIRRMEHYNKSRKGLLGRVFGK